MATSTIKAIRTTTSTRIGLIQGNGTITLSQSIDNFDFLYIRIGFYADGFPCYATALIPVSAISINSDTKYAEPIYGKRNNEIYAVLNFPTKTSFTVSGISDTNRYVVVYGIR